MGRRKKIERFKISSFRNPSGTEAWRVIGTKAGGTRVRQNFREQRVAIQAKADLESEYAGAETKETLRKTVLTADQLSDAEAAVRAYPWGSIASVAADYRRLEEPAAALGITLDEATRYAEAHYRPEHQEISVHNAREQYIKAGEGLRPLTIVHRKYSTHQLLKPDPA